MKTRLNLETSETLPGMRFVFRIEANEKRDQTEDEAQWNIGRKKRKGEARFLLPAFLCAQIFI